MTKTPAPLTELTLTMRQLRDARNELKTLSFTEVGAIIHGLRRSLQHDTTNLDVVRGLLERLAPTAPYVGQLFTVTGRDPS